MFACEGGKEDGKMRGFKAASNAEKSKFTSKTARKTAKCLPSRRQTIHDYCRIHGSILEPIQNG